MMRLRYLIVIVALAIILVFVFLLIPKGTEPEPNNTVSDSPQTITKAAQLSPPATTSQTDDEGKGFSESDEESIFLNAQQAATAYVTQPNIEPASDRQARLEGFFAPTSKAIAADVPSPSIFGTADIQLVETSWYESTTANPAVIIYLKVSSSTGTDIQTAYQGWVLTMVNYRGAWLANTIEKSDLPYIQDTAQ